MAASRRQDLTATHRGDEPTDQAWPRRLLAAAVVVEAHRGAWLAHETPRGARRIEADGVEHVAVVLLPMVPPDEQRATIRERDEAPGVARPQIAITSIDTEIEQPPLVDAGHGIDQGKRAGRRVIDLRGRVRLGGNA